MTEPQGPIYLILPREWLMAKMNSFIIPSKFRDVFTHNYIEKIYLTRGLDTCIFMFAEPLSGWRKVSSRIQRTKIDWALELEELLRTKYAKAEKIILVCDNLNTHTRGAFYEAFPVEKAREIVKRIEFRYTPKHGSWLNISENELSSMTRQCLKNRRIGDIDTLRQQTEAWATKTNKKQRGVDWQFTIGDARCKLKSVYPKIKE